MLDSDFSIAMPKTQPCRGQEDEQSRWLLERVKDEARTRDKVWGSLRGYSCFEDAGEHDLKES